MLADLEQLIKLQKVEDDAAVARARIEQIPATIETLGARLEASTEELAVAQQKLDDSRGDRRELEKKLAAVQTRLDRFREQLMQVKTNKEYQAMLLEIETIERQIEAKEDQVLGHMLASEDRLEEKRTLEQESQTRDKELRLSRTEAESFSSHAAAEIDRLKQERENLATALPPGRLFQYQRISDARGGRAISQIIDGSCRVCNVVLRKQLIAEVKTSARIATCDACNRILYYSAD